MPIFVEGMACPICGGRLDQGDQVLIPPFAANPLDPLFKFSDGAFHQACLAGLPSYDRLAARVALFEERTALWPPHCHRCGDVIADPESFVSFPFLCDGEAELASLNYRSFHRECLRRWTQWPAIRSLLADLSRSGAWADDALRDLVLRVDRAR